MKREYIQPKVDIVNLTSTTSFLAGSTQNETKDEWADGDDSGNDWNDDEGNNAPADPWA